MISSPIADRLAQLREQWSFFTERAYARLLIWQATDEEQTLIDAFVAQESEPESAATPDLFLQLSAPFRAEPGHGYALSTELCELYEEASQRPVAAQSVRWRCPTSPHLTDDVETFVSVLASLRSHLVAADGASILAVWLMPDEVRSWEAYLLWLHRLAQKLPANLRVLVVDRRAAPQYAPLAQVEPVRVMEKACDLSLPAALKELAASAGADTPGGAFRALQTECAAHLTAGDFEAAVRSGTSASELAKAQGWPHLVAVASMMLAASYSAQQKPSEALTSYAQAESLGA